MAPVHAGVFCLPQFEEEELAVASQLLRSEAEFVRKAMTHGDLGLPGKRLLGWWCCGVGVFRGQGHDTCQLVLHGKPSLSCSSCHGLGALALSHEMPPALSSSMHAAMQLRAWCSPFCLSCPIFSPAEYSAAWEAVAKDIIFVPAQQRYTRAASATAQDRVASLQVGMLRGDNECSGWGCGGAGLRPFSAALKHAPPNPLGKAGMHAAPGLHTLSPLPCSLLFCRLSLMGCARKWRRRPSGRPSWSRRWACWLF